VTVSIGWQAGRVTPLLLLPVPFLIGQANAAAVHLARMGANRVMVMRRSES